MDLAHRSFHELYVEYCSEITDAPSAYHHAVAYLVLSSIVNRKVYLPFGPEKLYPNLYLLIVGPSTLKRKSWSVKLGRRLISEIYPDFQIQETSSREAFIAELARRDRTPSGTGLIYVDELKGFVDRVKKGNWHQGFLQDLSTLYDCEMLRRRRGVSEKEKEEYVIEEPFVNLAACCSFDWLSNSIESSDLLGGFFSRFVWIVDNEPVTKIKTHPSPGDPKKFEMLKIKLHRINEYIGGALWTHEADEIYDSWVQTWRVQNQGGQWDSNYDRLTFIAQKLALLHCVARTEAHDDNLSPVLHIQPADIKPAIQFAMKTTTAFKDVIVADGPQDLLLRRVAGKIQKEHRIAHSDLLRGVRGMYAHTLENILETLGQAEVIAVIQTEEKNSLGRTFTKSVYEARKGLVEYIKK